MHLNIRDLRNTYSPRASTGCRYLPRSTIMDITLGIVQGYCWRIVGVNIINPGTFSEMLNELHMRSLPPSILKDALTCVDKSSIHIHDHVWVAIMKMVSRINEDVMLWQKTVQERGIFNSHGSSKVQFLRWQNVSGVSETGKKTNPSP